MCKIMEEIKAEGIAEGRAEGKLNLLKELISEGTLTITKAAEKMGLSEDAFRKIACL